MNNVGPAYESTVSSAQARDKPISYDDLIALLFSAEMRLKSQNTPAVEINHTATDAPKSNFHNTHGRGSGNSRGTHFREKGRGRGSFIGASNAGFSSNNSNRPLCQIYNRPYHTPIDCHQHMNQAYEGRVPTQKLMAMAATTSFTNNPSIWISDAGASNHITADLANLSIHEPYNGNVHVAVGNGSGPKDGEDAFLPEG